MANVQHASLPDAELHEPKGVVDASSGEVYVADGSASGAWTALEDIEVPKDFTGSDGYIDLPGGLILQWGRFISNTDTAQTVTFPKAFTTICWHVSVSVEFADLGGSVSNMTTTNFVFNRNNNIGGSGYCNWFAIGY